MDGTAVESSKVLHMKFHGRIIDQLGSQTYQSPVASIAELIANAWDADAHTVNVQLPDSNSDDAKVVIADDGHGLTFQECEDIYLNIGFCRRGKKSVARTAEGRVVLGRKGIGKFAGFGIARVIHVDTISKRTGERTSFEMDLDEVTGDEYMNEGGSLNAKYVGPDEVRKGKHGTKITLRRLTTQKSISKSQFPTSMARRFLLHQTVSEFQINVDGKQIPMSADLGGVEFSFPRDYRENEVPDGMSKKGSRGVEKIGNGETIEWEIHFYRNTIGDEELQGVTVFSNIKLAHHPFFFNLSGGLGGQHGQSYMSGYVVADYLDRLAEDVMSAERQRVKWDREETKPLLRWGQARVKELLRLWHDRRGESKQRALEERLVSFSARLEKLPRHEASTVKKTLIKLGGIPSLTDKQYESTANAILTAWETGRLGELMKRMESANELSSDQFLYMLVEAEVISALNVAEVINTKIMAIRQLGRLIEKRAFEDDVRNHLAENPWILSPQWDTFSREESVNSIIKKAADRTGLLDKRYQGRIDLTLSAGQHLLVLEFMRPGLKLDWDHLNRFKLYIRKIRTGIKANTATGFQTVVGLVVADSLDDAPELIAEIESLKSDDMLASDWKTLLDKAKSEYGEYMHILIERGEGDSRLESLKR